MFTARLSSAARVALRASTTSAPRTLAVRKTVAFAIPSLEARYAVSSIRAFNSSSALLNDKLDATQAPTSAEEEVKADHAATDPLASSSSEPSDVASQSAEPLSSSEPTQSTTAPTTAEAEVKADQSYVDPLQSAADATANHGEAAAAKPDPEEVASRTVFVSGLSWNVDNEWLREEVHKALETTEGVVTARVARNPMGKSKGFAFVEFESPALAQQLVNASPEIDFRPTQFTISDPTMAKKRPARETRAYDRNQSRSEQVGSPSGPRNAPTQTLWLGNLAWSTTDDELREVFESYGEIRRVHIPLDRETQRSRGIAYVEFEQQDAAEAAMDGSSDLELGGRTIRTDYAEKSFSNHEGGRSRGGNDGRRGGREGGWGGRQQQQRGGEGRGRGQYQAGRGRPSRDEGW